MRRFLKENSLSLVFLVMFLAALAGQAVAGWQQLNDQQLAEGFDTVGFADYLTSATFAVAVMENWQSEYLQFLVYVLATVWLLQKGSPESKQLDQAGPESDEEQRLGEHTEPGSPAWAEAGGWRTHVFSNSLVLVMGSIFLLSWGSYLLNADFWERTLQNWQSEFLAVGSMAVFSIYWRQRGSGESKSVGEPHASTGSGN